MGSELVGRWRIEDMELWDRDVIDLVEPGFIDIGRDGVGSLSFVAVVGSIDFRFTRVDGVNAVEFSWEGDDDGTPVSGRRSVRLSDDGQMDGRIFFHLGDGSWFTARRFDQRRVRFGAFGSCDEEAARPGKAAGRRPGWRSVDDAR
jgi:hypothetical protein